jgi:hypothetical protein
MAHSHEVSWQIASPLWQEALKDQGGGRRFHSPAILRFAGDEFIENLEAQLAQEPAGIKTLAARFETWREERSGWLTEAQLAQEANPLKLYQPVHNRFYLLAASLCCQIPGLPDKPVDAAAEEKTAFVLRRLVARPGKTVNPKDPSSYFEYGWFPGQGWLQMEHPKTVGGQEERLPMFPLAFGENGTRRRIFVGLLPAASRETFSAAPALSPLVGANGKPLADPRLEAFGATVGAGMMHLRQALYDQPDPFTQAQAQEAFVFMLLEFAEFIHDTLNSDWTMKNVLNQRAFTSGRTWASALQATYAERANILSGKEKDLSYLVNPLPGTADEIFALIRDAIDWLYILTISGGEFAYNSAFRALVEAALKDHPESKPQGDAVQAPKLDPAAGDFYLARCVYERPRCVITPPRPLNPQPLSIHPPVVSEASQAFQLASFFDPDAPARQMRIVMPVDTTQAGLRKFPKNVSVLISDQLKRQMQRIDGIKLADLDSGDVGEEGGLDLGMICSLSIPIITICALILLMIIVSLLNIVFWWLPFFKICLPLNLKMKAS